MRQNSINILCFLLLLQISALCSAIDISGLRHQLSHNVIGKGLTQLSSKNLALGSVFVAWMCAAALTNRKPPLKVDAINPTLSPTIKFKQEMKNPGTVINDLSDLNSDSSPNLDSFLLPEDLARYNLWLNLQQNFRHPLGWAMNVQHLSAGRQEKANNQAIAFIECQSSPWRYNENVLKACQGYNFHGSTFSKIPHGFGAERTSPVDIARNFMQKN